MTKMKNEITALQKNLMLASNRATGSAQGMDEITAKRARASMALAVLMEFARPHVDHHLLEPADELLHALMEVTSGHDQEWLQASQTPKGTLGMREAQLKALAAAGIVKAGHENIKATPAAKQMAQCIPELTALQILTFKKNLTRQNSKNKGFARLFYEGYIRDNKMTFDDVKARLESMKFVQIRKLRKTV